MYKRPNNPRPDGPNGLLDYQIRDELEVGYGHKDAIEQRLIDYRDTKKSISIKAGFALGVMAFGIQAGAQIFYPESSFCFAAISTPLSIITIGLFTRVLRKQKNIISDIYRLAAEGEQFLDSTSIDPKKVAQEDVRKTNHYINMN